MEETRVGGGITDVTQRQLGMEETRVEGGITDVTQRLCERKKALRKEERRTLEKSSGNERNHGGRKDNGRYSKAVGMEETRDEGVITDVTQLLL